MDLDEKLASALEEVYQDTDQKMGFVVYGTLIINFLCGVFYMQPILAITGCGIVYGLYYLAIYQVANRSIKNIFICLSLSSALVTLVMLSGGLAESRFYYFVLFFLLVLYQSTFVVHFAAVTAYLFTLVIFLVPLNNPDGDFSKFLLQYFIEKENLSYEKFIFSFNSEIVAHISALLFAHALHQRTSNSIYASLSNEEQLAVLEKNKALADEIANGNLTINYEVDAHDGLGQALLNMRKSLQMAAQKDEQEKFVNIGISEINELLRSQSDDLQVLSDKLMQKIVNYLEAVQGAIYLTETEENRDVCLRMTASYAYNRKKYLLRKIDLGEGLIGQAYLEKLPVYLTKIPKTYQSIDLGLGNIAPACVLIMPLLSQEKVVGILELAFLEKLEEFEIKFVQRISENIASAIVSVKSNEETKKLYAQSRVATEELQAREEEMRQNMEELEATQEEMRRNQQTMLHTQAKSKAFFESAINSIISFQEDGTIDEINPATERMFGYTAEDAKHLHIGDFISVFAGNHFQHFIGKRERFEALRKDKSTFMVQSFLNKYPIANKDLFILYTRDITDDLARENALRHSLTQMENMNREIISKKTHEEESTSK